jgi:hypothetical protein
MTELDQVWSKMLDEAAVKAVNSGSTDVAEYLRLKATNDAIRSRGVGWLFDTMIEIAGRALRSSHGLTIEREEPHNFSRGSSNMVGSRLQIRHGVRCLTVEAGWARVPSDGIMQKGSLAFARITHFGMPKLTVELRLVHAESLPHWLGDDESIIDSQELKRHFELFVG